MREATWAYLTSIEHEHERCGYETDPWRLANAAGIHVIPGKQNRGSAGPPSVITLAHDLYLPRQRYTLHHEISHVLMQRLDLEDAIAEEVDPEDANAHIEAVTNYAASLLLMPRPLVEAAVFQEGDSPAAILQLAQLAQASLPAAMRRYVYADPDARRAAFVTSGSYIADVASCNCRLPFWRYDRIPEVTLQHPEVSATSLSRGRVLGVVGS